MIVVDSNIIAYLYLPGDHTAAAETLLEHDPDWCAPLLWRSEFRNILAGCIRRGDVPLDTALAILDEAESLLQGSEYSVDSHAVLDFVNRSDCSAYDCEFVALADELQAKLITADKKILRSFPTIAIPLN